ncbi:uncharacterized protein LOC126900127 [Daktulosphaira vitifoliae]|uniref:uncharacterized protein LOC126900127 n=1 Tax=Daktulosphaira vitifoliae TaxID=58002 RepID=UPI0021A9F87F|nr:uncharacterized protein LOC126900127 [Daktulosphaira vitifoliae]
MSIDNQQQQPSLEQKDAANKNKRSILNDKTFLIDIVNNIISSKVEKLINAYGGKILQSLEKNTSYLISDLRNNEKSLENNDSEHGNTIENIPNTPSSKQNKSFDLISKATLLNVRIFSPKQFQQWLKSLLKKHRVSKSPVDKVASVLRGKISLKIESMDQGQCPVFEFIPKWPDLGDTLCKKKLKVPPEQSFEIDKSGEEYSSDQYSTSEIGGMCELCDVPFMNYKEHINTKKHLRESQDENKFQELDELINERPLSMIFNQISPENLPSYSETNVQMQLETSIVKSELDDSANTIVDTDSNDNEKNMLSLYESSTVEEKPLSKLKRKCCSDTNISYTPEKKRKTEFLSSCLEEKEEINYKKIKRKRKVRQKNSSKDIYKVEVINSHIYPNKSSDILYDDQNKMNKPPVIIRLKRVYNAIDNDTVNDGRSYSSDNCSTKTTPINASPIVRRYIRVVRKESFSNSEGDTKLKLKNLMFSFEQPNLHQKRSCDINYHPTFTCIPNISPSTQYVQESLSKLNDHIIKFKTLPFNKSLEVLSNMDPQRFGEWFYKIPRKIQDDLSFDSSSLVPLTNASYCSSLVNGKKKE